MSGPLARRVALLLSGALILGLTGWLRRSWLAADLPALAAGVLPDDAFYYFEIARRIGSEGVVSFDGTTPSTGFHPLWMLLLLPLFADAPPGATEPVRNALVIAAFLAACTAALLTAFAHRLTGRTSLALPLGLAFASNLWFVRESLNGLETSLSLVLVAALVLAALRYRESPQPVWAAVVGVLGALAVLARSDNVFAVSALALVCALPRRPWKERAYLLSPPMISVGALTVFNLVLTGRPFQSSALAVPWLVRANWLRVHPNATALDTHAHAWTLLRGTFLGCLDLLGPWASGVLLASTALLLIFRARLARATRHAAWVVAALVAGLLGLHVVHGYLRWYARGWYFVSWDLAAYAVAGVAFAALRDATSTATNPRKILSGILLVAAWTAFALEFHRTSRDVGRPQYPWQAEMVLAGERLRAVLPLQEAAGSFNAATIGYVSGRNIVNLDGVVNEDAAQAIRQRRLAAYLRARGIEHLVDYPLMWSDGDSIHATGPFFGPDFARAHPVVVERFDVPGVGWPTPGDAIVLLRLEWR